MARSIACVRLSSGLQVNVPDTVVNVVNYVERILRDPGAGPLVVFVGGDLGPDVWVTVEALRQCIISEGVAMSPQEMALRQAIVMGGNSPPTQ